MDFVEFPSHLFEFYALDRQCLEVYAPGCVRETTFPYIDLCSQILSAQMDQSFYAYPRTTSSLSTHGLRDHIASSFDSLDGGSGVSELLSPPIMSRFDHLLYYGGTYYCYLLCRSLACHVWDKALRPDPWSRAAGDELRSFLAAGSTDTTLGSILRLSATPGIGVPVDALLSDLELAQTYDRR